MFLNHQVLKFSEHFPNKYVFLFQNGRFSRRFFWNLNSVLKILEWFSWILISLISEFSWRSLSAIILTTASVKYLLKTPTSTVSSDISFPFLVKNFNKGFPRLPGKHLWQRNVFAKDEYAYWEIGFHKKLMQINELIQIRIQSPLKYLRWNLFCDDL